MWSAEGGAFFIQLYHRVQFVEIEDVSDALLCNPGLLFNTVAQMNNYYYVNLAFMGMMFNSGRFPVGPICGTRTWVSVAAVTGAFEEAEGWW